MLWIGATVDAQGRPIPAPSEIAFWNSIKDTRDPEILDAYLASFPESAFAAAARARRGRLGPAARKVGMPRFTVAALDRQMIALKNTNVRAGPSTSHARLATLARGARVAVTGEVAGRAWFRISLNDGVVGYVHAKLVGPTVATKQSARGTPAVTRHEPPEAKPTTSISDELHDAFEQLRPYLRRALRDDAEIREATGVVEIVAFRLERFRLLGTLFDKAIKGQDPGTDLPFDLDHELDRLSARFGPDRCAPMSIGYPSTPNLTAEQQQAVAMLTGRLEELLHFRSLYCRSTGDLIAEIRKARGGASSKGTK